MRLSRVSCWGIFIALVISISSSSGDASLLGFALRALALLSCLGLVVTRPRIKVGAVLLFLAALIFLKALYAQTATDRNVVPVFFNLFWIIFMLFQIHYPPGAGRYLPAVAKTVLKLVAAITIGLLLVSHYFPKIQFNLAGDLSQSRVGFGNGSEMSPGEFSNLVESGQPVFHVRTQPEISDESRPYWRGFVLDQTTDGFHWGVGIGGKKNNVLASENLPPSGAMIAQDFFLEPQYSGYGFVLDYPLSINPRRRIGDIESYFALSAFQPREHAESLSLEDERRYLILPADIASGQGSQKVRQLVQGLDRSQGEAKIISQLLGFFAKGFHYSLSPGTYGPGEISKFLFEKKIGFCEHFAGSFAVLLRLSGVPSRVVLGFHGGQWNSFDHSWLIRERDAHAWVEYWSRHHRAWMRVDPTSVVEPSPVQSKDSYFARIEQALDALSMSWKWTLFRHDDLVSRISGLWNYILRGGFLALTIFSILFGSRAFANWFQARNREDLAVLYHHYCQLMVRQGAVRQPFEGPFRFFERCSRLFSPEKIAICKDFTTLYVSLRYGQVDEPKDAEKNFQELKRLLNLIRRFPSV